MIPEVNCEADPLTLFPFCYFVWDFWRKVNKPILFRGYKLEFVGQFEGVVLAVKVVY